MESNEREAKLKASSRQRATHGQMDDAFQPIRARALLTLCYKLRSHIVRSKDTVDPVKQDGVVYKIPCECGKVYIGETGRSMHERIKEHDRDILI